MKNFTRLVGGPTDPPCTRVILYTWFEGRKGFEGHWPAAGPVLLNNLVSGAENSLHANLAGPINITKIMQAK